VSAVAEWLYCHCHTTATATVLIIKLCCTALLLVHCLPQIGAVHAERGELEQALATYLEALEHSPENPEILTTLGLTFLRCVCACQACGAVDTSSISSDRLA
jgi:hypothetical protein